MSCYHMRQVLVLGEYSFDYTTCNGTRQTKFPAMQCLMTWATEEDAFCPLPCGEIECGTGTNAKAVMCTIIGLQ